MHPDDELCGLDAAGALQLLRERSLGVLEYTDALLRRVEARHGLHALIHADPDRVRAAARVRRWTRPVP